MLIISSRLAFITPTSPLRLKTASERMKKRRRDFRDSIEKVSAETKTAAKILKPHNCHVGGHPSINYDQPELLSSIIKIVEASTAADDHRHTETLRTVKTLADLHSELTRIGFKLSRSALYLRLMPRRGDTHEGKRHIQTVPVKLLYPENSLRKKNVDRMFAKLFIDDIFELCGLLGPDAVTFMSNDDKARVALGLAAASLQVPILMHIDYRVRLPDHSFVVGDRHTLIPSVYGICEISKRGVVTYSGTKSL